VTDHAPCSMREIFMPADLDNPVGRVDNAAIFSSTPV
jgi:hypothetical protein